MNWREKLAYLICPRLRVEVNTLREGNTRVVLENSRLYDEIATLQDHVE